MVSGKPPRRSKATDDPVTIDLTAEETKSAADSGNAEADALPSDTPTSSAVPDEPTASATASNDAPPETPADPWTPTPEPTAETAPVDDTENAC